MPNWESSRTQKWPRMRGEGRNASVSQAVTVHTAARPNRGMTRPEADLPALTASLWWKPERSHEGWAQEDPPQDTLLEEFRNVREGSKNPCLGVTQTVFKHWPSFISLWSWSSLLMRIKIFSSIEMEIIKLASWSCANPSLVPRPAGPWEA